MNEYSIEDFNEKFHAIEANAVEDDDDDFEDDEPPDPIDETKEPPAPTLQNAVNPLKGSHT